MGAWDDLDIKGPVKENSDHCKSEARWIPCSGIHYRGENRLKACFIGEESEKVFPTET